MDIHLEVWEPVPPCLARLLLLSLVRDTLESRSGLPILAAARTLARLAGLDRRASRVAADRASIVGGARTAGSKSRWRDL